MAKRLGGHFGLETPLQYSQGDAYPPFLADFFPVMVCWGHGPNSEMPQCQAADLAYDL